CVEELPARVNVHGDTTPWLQTRARYASARDRVSPANAGEHFPERVENAVHGCSYGLEVSLVDVRLEHLALGSRVFPIRFEVNREILVVLRVGESVASLQSVYFRFTDRWNLAFVRVERAQSFRGRSIAA